MKGLGSCHRVKRGVYSKKGEDLLVVKKRKKESAGICGRSAEERIYLTL